MLKVAFLIICHYHDSITRRNEGDRISGAFFIIREGNYDEKSTNCVHLDHCNYYRWIVIRVELCPEHFTHQR